jgi:hypothetical protein
MSVKFVKINNKSLINAVLPNVIMLSVEVPYYEKHKQKIKRKTFNFMLRIVKSFSFNFLFKHLVIRCLDTQHNGIEHNGIYRNDIQHSKKLNATLSIMT